MPLPLASPPPSTATPTARIQASPAGDALLESLADACIGTFEVDLQTRETRWSPEVFEMFGLVAPEATVQAAHDRVHPEDEPRRSAALDGAVQAGADGRYALEFRVVRPGGDIRWLKARGRVVRDPDPAGEAVFRLVGVVHDETDRRRAETDLAASGQRRDRFLALLAHDLRNPLAPLHTAAELMKRAEMQPARITAISDMLSRQVAQMSHLIDDLVDISRANQGKIELHRQTVELGSVVDQAVGSVRGFVERRRQAIETELDDPAVTLDADPERLVQILTHLLEQASRSSTEDAVIRVAARREPGEWALTVSDDGAGIEPERLAQVFDLYPAAESDPNRRQTLGTGMALVKALTVLHGGAVEASSDGPGQGATYTVRLPRAGRA